MFRSYSSKFGTMPDAQTSPHNPFTNFGQNPIRDISISLSNTYNFPQPKQPPFTTLNVRCLPSLTILHPQSSHCVVNGKASKCCPCFSSNTNQQTPSTRPSKSSTPTYKQPIPFFFTISQNCTPADQTLTILASSVSPTDILRQTPSLSAASPDWCLLKSTRWTFPLFDSLHSYAQRTLPLPKFFHNKKAIVNVQTEDEQCFGYAIASALHPTDKNSNRPKEYLNYFEEERLLDLEYPVNPVDIPQLE